MNNTRKWLAPTLDTYVNDNRVVLRWVVDKERYITLLVDHNVPIHTDEGTKKTYTKIPMTMREALMHLSLIQLVIKTNKPIEVHKTYKRSQWNEKTRRFDGLKAITGTITVMRDEVGMLSVTTTAPDRPSVLFNMIDADDTLTINGKEYQQSSISSFLYASSYVDRMRMLIMSSVKDSF